MNINLRATIIFYFISDGPIHDTTVKKKKKE